MTYSNKKLTPDNIAEHLDETAPLHNGMGANVVSRLVSAGVNVANLARALGTRPETATKYKNLLQRRTEK